MTYQETTEYLFNSTPVFEHVGAAAYKEGLSNSLALDAHLEHPHRKFKSVHVAGTNGKGSTAHTLASILQESGLKVGLYTSPHLVDFRERIRVNGEPVPEAYVIDFVEQHRSFFEPLHPSFFELTTAMAFRYFADKEVDIAVIEVGLGGRLDCTNIISPLLSIITNISFDHTAFLGNTLAQIAREKAGIIKPNTPVVVGETTPETRPVFTETAESRQAELRFAEDEDELIDSRQTDNGIRLRTKHFGELTFQLGGSCQPRNARTILSAAQILIKQGIIGNPDAIANGFARVCQNTRLRGRWQQLQTQPTVICDTGHNVAGWQYIASQLRQQRCDTLRILFGMVDDKDISAVLALLPQNARYYFTQAASKRAIPAEKVAELASQHNLTGSVFGTVAEAYTAALAESTAADFVFVGGSSYVVSDLLSLLNK